MGAEPAPVDRVIRDPGVATRSQKRGRWPNSRRWHSSCTTTVSSTSGGVQHEPPGQHHPASRDALPHLLRVSRTATAVGETLSGPAWRAIAASTASRARTRSHASGTAADGRRPVRRGSAGSAGPSRPGSGGAGPRYLSRESSRTSPAPATRWATAAWRATWRPCSSDRPDAPHDAAWGERAGRLTAEGEWSRFSDSNRGPDLYESPDLRRCPSWPSSRRGSRRNEHSDRIARMPDGPGPSPPSCWPAYAMSETQWT